MDTALPQKFPFILDRNLANANCTGNRVCTSCDTVVLASYKISKFSHFDSTASLLMKKRRKYAHVAVHKNTLSVSVNLYQLIVQ